MQSIVTTLYILGYALVILSVIVAVPATKKAIEAVEAGGKEIYRYGHSERDRLRIAVDWKSLSKDDATTAQHRIDQQVAQAIKDRARDLDIPYKAGLAIGGAETSIVASTIRHIGRANKLTAFLALLGGLASTVASVWSLYL